MSSQVVGELQIKMAADLSGLLSSMNSAKSTVSGAMDSIQEKIAGVFASLKDDSSQNAFTNLTKDVDDFSISLQEAKDYQESLAIAFKEAGDAGLQTFNGLGGMEATIGTIANTLEDLKIALIANTQAAESGGKGWLDYATDIAKIVSTITGVISIFKDMHAIVDGAKSAFAKGSSFFGSLPKDADSAKLKVAELGSQIQTSATTAAVSVKAMATAAKESEVAAVAMSKIEFQSLDHLRANSAETLVHSNSTCHTLRQRFSPSPCSPR